jgi:ATP:cob(I)alamin adenosyltransferase
MGIYTKKGDAGETSLFGGTRLAKDSLRVDCYGTVDEANSVLGVIYAGLQFDELKAIVRQIQNDMFIVASMLASDETGLQQLADKIGSDDVTDLENIIDRYTEEVGAISHFILPGDTVASSLFHVARTIVRRAERHVVTLASTEYVDPVLIKYLNRLSDALFILARAEAYGSYVREAAVKVLEKLKQGGKTVSENITQKRFEIYDRMAEAARLESERLNVPTCFAVCNETGDLQYFRRMPGALRVSISISENKAYTAANLKMKTEELAPLVQPGGQLYGMNISYPKLITFGGGIPLKIGGRVVGGVGVSGGTAEEDILIANKAIEAFAKLS